ncbi:MAG: peptidyl-prolyl cis-trans isomerase [Candidatus Omnitrophota bacterium]
MRSFIRHARILLFSVIAINFLCVKSHAVNDTIIAVVNDEVITYSDLADYVNAIYLQLVTSGTNPQQIQEVMQDLEANGLQRLIEDKIIIGEAKRMELIVREKVVEEKIETIKKKYPSEEDFLFALVSNGSTLTDLRNKITEQLQVQYTIDYNVRSKIFVHPQEVTEYYREHQAKYKKRERVKLDSISVLFNNEPETTRQKAQQALERLKAGDNFDAVAKKYSDTPSIGLIEKGQLLPNIEETVFGLKVGDISELIETDSGIYIFKMRETLPPMVVPLEEAKNDIYNEIFQKKFQERYQKWMGKLREQAYVEIKK